MPNIEIVVVDDASQDTTTAFLKAQAKVGDLSVIRNETPLERSGSRNRGATAVKTAFILWLDDDDRLMPETLERLSTPLRRHSEAVAAIGARVTFDQRGNRVRIRHPKKELKRSELWRELLVGWVVPSGQTLCRREVFDSVRGWDESLATPEDQALWMQLSLEGPVCFVPDLVLEQRAHDGQWRPSDLSEVEAAIRERFVDQLEGPSRREAQRLFSAWKERLAAKEARRAGRRGAMFFHTVRASWLARGLFGSPIVGADLRDELAAAIFHLLVPERVATIARSRRMHRREAAGEAIAPAIYVSDKSASRSPDK